MSPNLELGLNQLLARGRSELLETRDLDLREGLERKIREWWPAPQRQRLAQLSRTELGALALARLRDEAQEAVDVDKLGVDVEHVARRACPDNVGAEHLAQLGNEVLE